jgi:hypothetical protein
LLAWRSSANSNIQIASLTSADQLAGTLAGISGLQVHDMVADANGAVLAVMDNDADIYTSKYCYGSSTTSLNVCGKMDLVRLNNSGAVQFRTTLTNKVNVDDNGALFIWWYGHTARIASSGSLYGVYYRTAGSYTRSSDANEVDIHSGDSLRFVNSAGVIQSGGWDWGCSHSWSVRLAYNGSWGAACHGDAYPNAMRLDVLASPTATAVEKQWLASSDPTGRALGGMVPVSGGFWINYVSTDSGTLRLHLARISNSGSIVYDQVVSGATGLDSTYPFRAYMASYGSGRLLLGWKSGGALVLAVASASTGEILEGPVTTGASIDNFQEFVTAANGDVLWAYSGGSNIKVNRVSACQ